MSFLVLMHFLIVHFTNLMHASSCPFLWWYYDDDVDEVFAELLNIFSETKLPPASAIIFLVKAYSEKRNLLASIKLSVDRSPAFL